MKEVDYLMTIAHGPQTSWLLRIDDSDFCDPSTSPSIRKLFHELPVQVRCTILDAWDWCTGTTQRDGMGREEGSGWGTHVYLWRIHFDIWQN